MTKTREEITQEVVVLMNDLEIFFKDRDQNVVINALLNTLITKTVQFDINPIMVVTQLIVGLKANHDSLMEMNDIKLKGN